MTLKIFSIEMTEATISAPPYIKKYKPLSNQYAPISYAVQIYTLNSNLEPYRK